MKSKSAASANARKSLSRVRSETPRSTSTWIAFLEGEHGEDIRLLDKALEDRQVLMIPVVLTELLSDPGLSSDVAETLAEIPMIEIGPGYWQRAGALRARVLSSRRKARLGDAWIAQTCPECA
jgi:hypothetical protein